MFTMDRARSEHSMMILVLSIFQFIASSMELFGQICVNQTLTTLEVMQARERI